MLRVALIAVAGAAGAVARYGVGVSAVARELPYATLGVNLAGSYLLGLVLSVWVQRGWPDVVVVPVAVGFLGSFTTFSTFSYEVLTLLRGDRVGAAAAYVLASVVGGVLAAAAGWATARAVG